jgi:hypothetical protein
MTQSEMSAIALEMLRHPVRMRLVTWLSGHPQGQTQREMGAALSLSTAAIHYHIKLLENLNLAKVASTRPGPNGITEKLYMVEPEALLTGEDKYAFYKESTFAHMQEMQREGESLLDAEGTHRGAIAGTYECYATEDEIHALSSELLAKIEAFHSTHKRRQANTQPVAITIGVLPSQGAGWTGNRRSLDFLA